MNWKCCAYSELYFKYEYWGNNSEFVFKIFFENHIFYTFGGSLIHDLFDQTVAVYCRPVNIFSTKIKLTLQSFTPRLDSQSVKNSSNIDLRRSVIVCSSWNNDQ